MSFLGWGSGSFGGTPWGGFDLSQFKKDFPEFDSDKVTDPNAFEFTDSQINYYANLAVLLLNPQRWDTLIATGVELFIAHNIVLEALAMREMNAGGIPGVAKGIVNGKSAGDVSIAYDTNSVLEIDAGHWNYTIYGKRFIHLVNLIGAGPVQMSGGGMSADGAWAGPPWWPGMFTS